MKAEFDSHHTSPLLHLSDPNAERKKSVIFMALIFSNAILWRTTQLELMRFSYSLETVSDTLILIEAMFQIYIIINNKNLSDNLSHTYLRQRITIRGILQEHCN